MKDPAACVDREPADEVVYVDGAFSQGEPAGRGDWCSACGAALAWASNMSRARSRAKNGRAIARCCSVARQRHRPPSAPVLHLHLLLLVAIECITPAMKQAQIQRPDRMLVEQILVRLEHRIFEDVCHDDDLDVAQQLALTRDTSLAP